MDLLMYDEDGRRYVPWLVTLAAIALVAVWAVVITLLLTRETDGPTPAGLGAREQPAVRDSSTPGPVGTPSVRPLTPATTEPSGQERSSASAGPAPACLEALRQADALSERSARVGQALSAHTHVMDELLAQRLNTDQALDQTLPVLTEGAKDRSSLDDVLLSYRQARRACQD